MPGRKLQQINSSRRKYGAYASNKRENASCGRKTDMLFSELKCKEVINLRDCRKLGHVTDFEFDQCTGCICKLIVPGGAKWKSFFSCDTDHVICYKDIKQIGPDLIIVDLPD